jgi:8-oxo-dGTP pyrophosphatase MutT (NUDIX family)
MPIRKPLIELLNAYNPVAPEEQRCKKQMLEFIQAHENCFERTLSVGHMTASVWLLSNDKTKALLMHHTKLDKWLQLGGHCDGDPDVLAVAIKEAQEESGIQAISPVSKSIFDIDIHWFPAMNENPAHYHYDVRFLLYVTSQEPITQNHEAKELRWIGKNRNELPTKNRTIVRMFDKWLSI